MAGVWASNYSVTAWSVHIPCTLGYICNIFGLLTTLRGNRVVSADLVQFCVNLQHSRAPTCYRVAARSVHISFAFSQNLWAPNYAVTAWSVHISSFLNKSATVLVAQIGAHFVPVSQICNIFGLPTTRTVWSVHISWTF